MRRPGSFERSMPFLDRSDDVAVVAASSAAAAASIRAGGGDLKTAFEVSHALASRFGDPDGLRRAGTALPFTPEAENARMTQEAARQWADLLAGEQESAS